MTHLTKSTEISARSLCTEALNFIPNGVDKKSTKIHDRLKFLQLPIKVMYLQLLIIITLNGCCTRIASHSKIILKAWASL